MAKEKPRGDIINHSEAADYVAPTDPLLLSRLEWFQDQKLALMVHWGGYSQWGICESWPLSDADASWSRRDVDWESDPARFRQQYFALNRTFHPVRFQPEAWARFAGRGFSLPDFHHQASRWLLHVRYPADGL